VPRHVTFLSLVALLLLAACGPGQMPPQKIGKPYVINGETYYPAYEPDYDKTGIASWYGPGFHGKYTASGEIFDQNDLTAAHTTLPMPSLVRVTNLKNGKSLVVRINDRGPFKEGRLIDLSKKSAKTLGIHGLAQVRVQFLEQETQDYIALVKQNGGRIIPMAEYHQQAMRVQVAAKEPEETSSELPIAAPVMTVSTTSTEDGGRAAPVQLIRSAGAEPSPLAMRSAAPPDSSMDGTAAEHAELIPAAAAPLEPIGGYTVQVGVFSLEMNAQKMASRFSDGLVDQISGSGQMLWRVTVGNFIHRDYAEETLKEVRTVVPDARIVRR
jgi:rare lipoprotein A